MGHLVFKPNTAVLPPLGFYQISPGSCCRQAFAPICNAVGINPCKEVRGPEVRKARVEPSVCRQLWSCLLSGREGRARLNAHRSTYLWLDIGCAKHGWGMFVPVAPLGQGSAISHRLPWHPGDGHPAHVAQDEPNFQMLEETKAPPGPGDH